MLTTYRRDQLAEQENLSSTSVEHIAVSAFLLQWLERQSCFASIKFVGHRIVHGMHHLEPQRVSPSLMSELRQINSYISEHLPREIEMIEAISWRHPSLTQVVCFDTAFHRTLPRVAKLLPIPRRFTENGIQRYGFHGLSYGYLMQELEKVGDNSDKGRVILTHLGSACSMAAVLNGSSIDTSMCFTPSGGLPMATHSGDIDPGLVCYLLHNEKMTNAQLKHLINYESGLLGISETSSDMREILAKEKTDMRCAEAIAIFCYQVKKWIGAYSAALGGLDTLVFTGGVGEHAASIRSRICNGLEHLGITLDETRNTNNLAVISTDTTSRVKVRIIHTNEELMIARSVSAMLPSRRATPREVKQEDYLG